MLSVQPAPGAECVHVCAYGISCTVQIVCVICVTLQRCPEFLGVVNFKECLYAFSHSIPIHCSTYPYVFILLLIRLMPVSLCLQLQHSHTLQYIPLCLHFAVGKAYACVPMPSATAFPDTAVHTPMPSFCCW